MVNFKQLIDQGHQPSVTEPRQLFQTLRRDWQHEYLRDVQGDVLDEWFKRREERDLVIKMNTGSGKTSVGLVLLWSRLKEGKGPALYLCPNTHLVSQVQREADKIGIKHVDFEMGNRFPSEFHDSTGIPITTVQKLFNGLSVFHVAGRPDPVNVGTILVDDAHACINIAREQFTASFPKESPVGERLASFFDTALQQQAIGMHADVVRGEFTAYIRVPYWAWQGRLSDVAKLFSNHYDPEELRFTWPFLKNGEVLSNSVAVISGDRVEVTPRLLPIDLIPTFHNAPHRIYMSATLVDDTALIKDFEANLDSIQNPITPKVGGDIGERLIIIPPLVDARIDERTCVDLVTQMQSDHQANVVVLVPSNRRGRIWETAKSVRVTAANISEVIDQLSTSAPNTAIIANRYDGIDLPDKACRVLVIDDLPQEHGLLNLSDAKGRQQSPILRKQIAQRIEQGMGRGVRSRADYCVVILTGKHLVSFVTQIENQSFFTEETKRQIEIGKNLATILRSQATSSYQAILALAAQCLNRDQDWQTYHQEQIQNAQTIQSATSDSIASASAELRAWNHAMRGQYDRAAEEIARLVDENNTFSDIDKGWYLQLQAEYLYQSNRVVAIEKQLKAHELNTSLLKPPQGVNYKKIQVKQTDQAYAILDWVQQSSELNAIVSRGNAVLDSLTFGIPHDPFEQALCDIASILGFHSHRPDHQFRRGPDVLWRMTNGHYLIFEAKNQIEPGRQEIYKAEAEQLGHHVTWFEQEYPSEPYTPILVHPSATLAYDAYLPTKARIIQQDDLNGFVESVRSFITALASKPMAQWTTTEVAALLETYKLRPTDLLSEQLGERTIRRRSNR